MIAQKSTQPGYDNQFEPASHKVESPYDGKAEVVPFNNRESNAKTLRLGPAQTKTYDHIWRLWYLAGHSRQMAVDPSHEPVDGGGASDPLPLKAFESAQKLRDIRLAIGTDRFKLIEWTCLDGLNYSQVAVRLFGQEANKRQLQETSINVKNAYNAAMYELGYAKPQHTIHKLHSHMEPDARPADRPEMREEG